MNKIRKSLRHVLLLPNGQFYGKFEKEDKDIFCTGYFKDENGSVKNPTLKEKVKVKWKWKWKWDANIDHKQILNGYQSKLRTKGIDTFFIEKKDSELIIMSSIYALGFHSGYGDPKCEAIFTSDGKSIRIALKNAEEDTEGARKAMEDRAFSFKGGVTFFKTTLPINSKKKFSFRLDARLTSNLRKDNLTVRIGENGLISFSSDKYHEDLHIQSLALSGN